MKRNLFFLVLALFIFDTITVHAQQVIAHRGYWKTDGSAQNSIAALMKADSIRVYGSEVDIWLSSDGIPVVNHDAEVTLDGEKLIIQDTPFATLRKVRLANGEPLPTAEEYLDAFEKCKNIKLIIEFKSHVAKEREDLLAEKIINIVRERGLEERSGIYRFWNQLCTAGKETCSQCSGLLPEWGFISQSACHNEAERI